MYIKSENLENSHQVKNAEFQISSPLLSGWKFAFLGGKFCKKLSNIEKVIKKTRTKLKREKRIFGQLIFIFKQKSEYPGW